MQHAVWMYARVPIICTCVYNLFWRYNYCDRWISTQTYGIKPWSYLCPCGGLSSRGSAGGIVSDYTVVYVPNIECTYFWHSSWGTLGDPLVAAPPLPSTGRNRIFTTFGPTPASSTLESHKHICLPPHFADSLLVVKVKSSLLLWIMELS